MNRLIDDVCHPLFREDGKFVLLDGFFHALVDRNPPVSVKKLVRYDLPRLMKELRKKQRAQSVLLH